MQIRIRTFLLCISLPAFSQQNAPPASRHVTLDVVVTDKSGKPVSGLQPSDFTLIDNKQTETPSSVQARDGSSAELPVEVILLVDRVNTTVQNSANVRIQVKNFLGQRGGQLALPTSMIFFSDQETTLPTEATRDGNALIALVNQSESGLRQVAKTQGIYAATDRFRMSIGLLKSIAALENKKPGRKMLIWLSPGWPLLTGPGMQLSAKAQQGLFNDIVETSTALLRARITLYSIDALGVAEAGTSRTGYYKEFLKGISAPKQVVVGDLGLQVIATQTGGAVLYAANDIGKRIDLCISDTSAWYVLTFDSPPADGPNEYHQLDVKVGKPGLTARTRTGYYAQP